VIAWQKLFVRQGRYHFHPPFKKTTKWFFIPNSNLFFYNFLEKCCFFCAQMQFKFSKKERALQVLNASSTRHLTFDWVFPCLETSLVWRALWKKIIFLHVEDICKVYSNFCKYRKWNCSSENPIQNNTDPFLGCRGVMMASGWESEGRWFDPRHHQTTFDPGLPKKHQKIVSLM